MNIPFSKSILCDTRKNKSEIEDILKEKNSKLPHSCTPPGKQTTLKQVWSPASGVICPYWAGLQKHAPACTCQGCSLLQSI